jgi:hypothetical protein
MINIIRASRRRRERFLAILPDVFKEEFNACVIRQSPDWSQDYQKGLVNHCFMRVVQLFVDKDELATRAYLKPLHFNYLIVPLMKDHRLFIRILQDVESFKQFKAQFMQRYQERMFCQWIIDTLTLMQ